jgi:hypothetical protein
LAPITICKPRNEAGPVRALQEPILMLSGVTPGASFWAKAAGRKRQDAAKMARRDLAIEEKSRYGETSARLSKAGSPSGRALLVEAVLEISVMEVGGAGRSKSGGDA